LRIEKIRLDELLLRQGLAPDLQKARSLILSGSVLLNDVVVDKVGVLYPINSNVRIRAKIGEYVSRGAYKLKPILEKWNIPVEGKVCLDIGASTGGFTQVLLEKKAKMVFAIDVGYGLLAGKLRNDSRVKVVDRFHIKNLSPKILEEPVSELFFTIDLSFISLKNVFPHILRLQQTMGIGMEGLSLLKPQFEADSSDLEKGILKNKQIQFSICKDMLRYLKKDFILKGFTKSPITGADGNEEFFIYWKLSTDSG
jgi:23S rRNA (cytidine1920-2'-O)/16S rRNA (cytidine1409-2'-O)-methyltransferase